MPYTLVDPEAFPTRADATDLFILKELEKDATIDLVDICEEAGNDSAECSSPLYNARFEKGIS